MLSIRDAKISFVAGASFADQMWSEGRPEAVLWSKGLYVAEYNQLRGGQGTRGFDLAWYEGQKSSFWRFYLGGQALGTVSASSAWDAFVPLRLFIGSISVTTDLQERVVMDVYGYELGVVVTVTVQPFKRASADLDLWVQRLRELRSDPVFRLAAREGPIDYTIDALLGNLVEVFRLAFYGGGGASVGSYEPVTIANILQADGGAPGTAVDVDIQRRLHAVTAWPDDWAQVILPPLGDPSAFLPMRSSNKLPGDALYAARRGVAVWRPGLFAPQGGGAGRKRRHTLSCLGHNLVAGAAQAEYLRLVALAYGGQPKMRDRLDQGRIRALGSVIDGLLRGTGTTYRSAYLKRILEDGNSKDQVNALISLAGGSPIP